MIIAEPNTSASHLSRLYSCAAGKIALRFRHLLQIEGLETVQKSIFYYYWAHLSGSYGAFALIFIFSFLLPMIRVIIAMLVMQ